MIAPSPIYEDGNPWLMFCGVDEAGRGPVIGPLVVACVYVEDDSSLVEIGVKDSKKLSPKVRERMYQQIIDSAADYSIVIKDASSIDALMSRMSLNDIEMEMFAEACSKRRTDAVYADCPDVDENRFSVTLSSRVQGPNIVGKHKADDTYPVVSAASILAKVTRDRMVEEIAETLGKDIGSGYPSDEKTMEFIRTWFYEKHELPPHVRRSWEPIKKLLMLSKNTRITDW